MRKTRGPFYTILSLSLLLGIMLGSWILPNTAQAQQNCSMQGYYDSLGRSENNGNYGGRDCNGPPGSGCACNTIGCCGKYQFCPSTLSGLGYNRTSFINSPQQQEEAIRRFTDANYRTLVAGGAGQYIGQTINGVTVTWSGLLGASHLGGAGGTLRMLRTNGAYNPNDGHTSLAQYMNKFAGYDTNAGSGGGLCGQSSTSPNAGRNGYQQVCDPEIQSAVTAQLDASVAKVQDYIRTNYTSPPALSQVSNSPCVSKELERISNQFSYAPTRYAQQITGNILSAGGPIGGIMQKLFKSEFDSINSAAASIKGMLDFQSMATNALGSLLGSLGLGSAFSSEMCGLMVDMLLKYVQCESPIKLPNIGNITGSLNDLIPNNCAGNALRSTLYEAGNMKSLQTLNQSIPLPSSMGSQ